MNVRTSLSILVFVLWCLLGFWFWNLSKKCCTDIEEENSQISLSNQAQAQDPYISEINSKVKSDRLISFNWKDTVPIFGDHWPSYRDSLSSKISESNKLLIEAFYSTEEENNTQFENIGLARAFAIASAGFETVDTAHIQLFSKVRDRSVIDSTHSLLGASLNLIRNTKNVKQTSDRTIIYFPFNSTKQLNSQDVYSYIDEVAERVSQSKERIFLTGHTDSSGAADTNIQLGLSRANIIKQLLVAKGVPPDLIIVDSKGESKPIAANNTANGRSKNRRTELQIKK